jgi:hypothetical protein
MIMNNGTREGPSPLEGTIFQMAPGEDITAFDIGRLGQAPTAIFSLRDHVTPQRWHLTYPDLPVDALLIEELLRMLRNPTRARIVSQRLSTHESFGLTAPDAILLRFSSSYAADLGTIVVVGHATEDGRGTYIRLSNRVRGFPLLDARTSVLRVELPLRTFLQSRLQAMAWANRQAVYGAPELPSSATLRVELPEKLAFDIALDDPLTRERFASPLAALYSLRAIRVETSRGWDFSQLPEVARLSWLRDDHDSSPVRLSFHAVPSGDELAIRHSGINEVMIVDRHTTLRRIFEPWGLSPGDAAPSDATRTGYAPTPMPPLLPAPMPAEVAPATIDAPFIAP